MIRVGIGGWTFEPWRETFFPPKLKHAEELAYASRHVTAIEINGTFYRNQKPESFRRWAADTPEDFVFSVKASRYCTARKALGEGGDSIKRFLESGVTELGHKLGPILWQLPPSTAFRAADIEAFLALLPRQQDGQTLRHVLEVRHKSFATPDFVALLRRRGAATVYADSDTYPAIADTTADFVYARLQRAEASEPAGYPPRELDAWAERARQWQTGKSPPDLPLLAPPAAAAPHDCFIFFINGAKERAPAAAMALIERLAR